MADIPAYAVSRSTRSSQIGMAIGLIVLIVLATAPWWAGRADLRLMIEIFYYLALAQLWNLLAGYTGLVSVGQQAFVGLGGYTLFALAVFGGVNPLAAIALAGVVAAIFALPTAFLVFRLRGAYFAIGTWVVAEVYRLGFAQVSALGGGSGMSLPADIVRSIADGRQAREWLVYWVALVIVLAAMGIVYALLRSRQGLALTAIRDSEPASESLGVNTYRTKLVIYIAVAFATGLVGALIFLQKLRISPDAAFSVNDWTAFVIFIVVIGGIGRIEGPIIGVIVFFVLRELFVDFGTWYLMLLGAVAVVIMLLAPRGLWGLLTDRWDIQIFPVRRALVVKETKDSG